MEQVLENQEEIKYELETRLMKKLAIMVDRCGRDKVEMDSVLIVEGSEGQGKSSASVAIAYKARKMFKETFNQDREIHLFFRLNSMLNFAKSTEKKIIIWDEPALDSLKKDSVSHMNKQLERLMMTCRKKRHFFIINMTKFYKFSEYIVVDRCIGMIHMYSRKEVEPGRFIYIKKGSLERLYRTYMSIKKRIYKDVRSFGGKFPEVIRKYFSLMGINVEGIPNATYEQYNEAKDRAIMSIGENETGMSKRHANDLKKLNLLRFGIYSIIKKYGIDQQEAAQMLAIDSRRLREWKKIDPNAKVSLDNELF